MIDILANEALGYMREGHNVRDAIDMTIANHITTSTYPTWVFECIESKVLERAAVIRCNDTL